MLSSISVTYRRLTLLGLVCTGRLGALVQGVRVETDGTCMYVSEIRSGTDPPNASYWLRTQGLGPTRRNSLPKSTALSTR
jgi:hypothetical protein